MMFDRKTIIKRLSRVTSSGAYIPEIDGLRFVAIAPVVLMHLRFFMIEKTEAMYSISPKGHWLANLTIHGHYGVQLFFVISGFVLATPYAAHYLKNKRPVILKQYFLRRLTRLEPPYIICLLICFALFVLLGKGRVPDLLPHLIAGIVYAHTLIYNNNNILNIVAWSLEVEVQFYLLVPLIANIFRVKNKKTRRSILVVIIVLSLAVQPFIVNQIRLELSIVNNLQFFLIGFLLSDMYLCDWNEKPSHDLKWDLISFVGWPSLLVLFGWPMLTHYLLPFFLLILYIGVFRGVVVRKILTLPIITITGGMCYTIYLIHFQILSLAVGYIKPIFVIDNFAVNFVVELLILLPILLIFCVTFFLLVEKPCMQKDWPKRFIQRVCVLFNLQPKSGKSSPTTAS